MQIPTFFILPYRFLFWFFDQTLYHIFKLPIVSVIFRPGRKIALSYNPENQLYKLFLIR